MKRLFALAIFASAPALYGSAVMTLDPVGGVIAGPPGSTVGWGFSVINGANWITIDSVSIENETSPLGGTSGGFTSYMDQLGGESNGVTAPGDTWNQGFAPGAPGTGVGQYAIDPGTAVGASDSGDFVIFYDEFTADPNSCGSCFLDTLQMFDADSNPPAFTINVTPPSSSAPEPGTGGSFLLGALALARVVRRWRVSAPARAPFSEGDFCSRRER
jgi:hypothetical protein